MFFTLQCYIWTHVIFYTLCAWIFLQEYDFSCINLNKLSNFNVFQDFT